MFLKKRYDDKEVECNFCHYKGKPIIEINKMRMFVGKSNIRAGGNRGSGIPIKEKRYILFCPKCKAIIGTK